MAARSGLPEREWYSLADIAKRWESTETDLVHLAGRGLLRLGFVADAIRITGTGTELERYGLEFYEGFATLTRAAAADLEHADSAAIHTVLLPDREAADELIRWDVGECPPGSRFFDPEFRNLPEIERSDLVIHRDERDRFEGEHDIGKGAKRPKGTESPDARREGSYLAMILAMDRALELPAEPFKAAVILEQYATQQGLELPEKKTLAAIVKRARARSS